LSGLCSDSIQFLQRRASMKSNKKVLITVIALVCLAALASVLETGLPKTRLTITKMQVVYPVIDNEYDDPLPANAVSVNCKDPWNLFRGSSVLGREEFQYRFMFGQGDVAYQTASPPRYSHYAFYDIASEPALRKAVLHGTKIMNVKCYRVDHPIWTYVQMQFWNYDVRADSLHEVPDPPNIYKEEEPSDQGEPTPINGATYVWKCLMLNTWVNGTLVSSEIIPGTCWQSPQWQ
jgi:hypothetical protein